MSCHLSTFFLGLIFCLFLCPSPSPIPIYLPPLFSPLCKLPISPNQPSQKHCSPHPPTHPPSADPSPPSPCYHSKENCIHFIPPNTQMSTMKWFSYCKGIPVIKRARCWYKLYTVCTIEKWLYTVHFVCKLYSLCVQCILYSWQRPR